MYASRIAHQQMPQAYRPSWSHDAVYQPLVPFCEAVAQTGSLISYLNGGRHERHFGEWNDRKTKSAAPRRFGNRTQEHIPMGWHRTEALFIAGLVATQMIAAVPAAAQTYPTRPVTIVVPFAAGGGNDILARLIAQHMGQALGQQFVIENRAGAGGTIGARAVAKAPADGYTLMVGHSGVFGVAPALYVDPGYEPQRDFAPIGLIASYQQVLVT